LCKLEFAVVAQTAWCGVGAGEAIVKAINAGIWLLSAALFVVLPGAAAQAQNEGARLDVSQYFAAKDYPQTANFPGGVIMTTVTYSTLPGFRPLTMDVYKPAGDAVHPGLVFIHGGNWNGGTSRSETPFGDFPGVLAAIAAHGYVVMSPNYRLSSEAKFPAALIDSKAAIQYFRAHARDYHLDADHVASWGASAGGYLAVMVGLTCGVAAFEPSHDATQPVTSDCVQASIDWSGLLVLEHMFTDFGKPMPATSVEGAFLGCEPNACPAEILRLANPMTYVGDKSPPMLIQHGDADAQIPTNQPQDLYNALRARSVRAEFVIYRNSAHMFTNPNRAQNGSAADPVNDQAALDKVVQFLDATFPQKK
jgi:acetyl esterase/lipase